MLRTTCFRATAVADLVSVAVAVAVAVEVSLSLSFSFESAVAVAVVVVPVLLKRGTTTAKAVVPVVILEVVLGQSPLTITHRRHRLTIMHHDS